jgi:glutathione S-transferase
VAISLLERRLPHEKTLVDLQDKPEDFKALYAAACADPSMSAKVPILTTDDGDTLIESMVILEFLEDHGAAAAAQPKYTAEEMATARLWATLVPTWLNWFSVLRADPGSEAEAEAVEKLHAGLRAMDAFLETRSKGDGPFVLGEAFSLAECATAPFAQRLNSVLPGLRPELDVSKYLASEKLAHVARWMTAVCERPSCVETLPPKEELQTSYVRLMERFKAMPAGGAGGR